MSMHKFMHPRNIYRQKPDFNELVKQFPELKEVASVDLNGRIKLDYKNESALQLLTRCLLRRDFGLELELPAGSLVPTLPLRLNYILWLEDVEQALGWKDRKELRGLDIGCGASCIYPLLAVVRSKRRWKMVGLEQVAASVESAKRNVERNGFSNGEIEVIKQEDGEETILKGFLERREGERFDFCMCNPPFYEEGESRREDRTGKRKEPSAASTGSCEELRTEGGELRFVERIIEESLELKERITVYTSMLGHKRNFDEILRILKSRAIDNVKKTRFCQGNTTRWAVAWSFSSEALLYKVPDLQQTSNGTKKAPGKPLKSRIFSLDEVESLPQAKTRLSTILTAIDLELTAMPSCSDKEALWKLTAQENTWSHQRRKRRQSKANESASSETLESPVKRLKPEPVLTAALCLRRTTEGYELALSFLAGTAGKDAVNQILQYVKNEVK